MAAEAEGDSLTSFMEVMDADPGVRLVTGAAGPAGRALVGPPKLGRGAGFLAATTPSDTDARGRGAAADLTEDVDSTGEMTDGREDGSGGFAADALTARGAVAGLEDVDDASVEERAGGAGLAGARDALRAGTAVGVTPAVAVFGGIVLVADGAEVDAGFLTVDVTVRGLGAVVVAGLSAGARVEVMPEPNLPEFKTCVHRGRGR